MNRCLFAVLLAPTVVLALASFSHSEDYNVVWLGMHCTGYYPKISDNGWVVYEKLGIQGLWLYDGETSTKIGHGNHTRMNAHGWVVWHGSDLVYGNDGTWLYDGSTHTKVSASCSYPEINDKGEVVCRGSDGSDNEIFLYDGSALTQITNNAHDDWSPQINNNGYVAWFGGDIPHREIYLYDGTNTAQLTHNAYEDKRCEINNSGWVVWQGCDGADCHGGDGDYEIFLYDGISVGQITDNDGHDVDPQIGNNGWVVWQSCDGGSNEYCDGGDWELFLYDGVSTVRLTNNDEHDRFPHMNDNGYIVWAGGEGQDSEIFLYDGVSTTQLTDNSLSEGWPRMNREAHIVWARWPPSQIYIAIPCSIENDNDGDLFVSAFCGGEDCNDSDPNIYPTNPNPYCSCEEPYPEGTDEICGDGMDNDCNGTVDDKDQDHDGYIDEECGGTDCDDSDYYVNPGRPEIPGNEIDDDCDPATPAYPQPANTTAAGYGRTSLMGSGAFNSLGLLLIPVGAVILLRISRRIR
jgi:hypothetical protein